MEGSGKEETLADLRRLTAILLSNLEEGSKNRLMDPRELRMLSAAAIRAIRLYLTTIGENRDKRPWIKRVRREEGPIIIEDLNLTGKD